MRTRMGSERAGGWRVVRAPSYRKGEHGYCGPLSRDAAVRLPPGGRNRSGRRDSQAPEAASSARARARHEELVGVKGLFKSFASELETNLTKGTPRVESPKELRAGPDAD